MLYFYNTKITPCLQKNKHFKENVQYFVYFFINYLLLCKPILILQTD